MIKAIIVFFVLIFGTRVLANQGSTTQPPLDNGGNDNDNTPPLSQSDRYVEAVFTAYGVNGFDETNTVRLIVDAFNSLGDGDNNKLAYIIATAWHESFLKPIREIRCQPGTQCYDRQEVYWDSGYFGRGYVQLTFQSNYQTMSNLLGVDLVANPDLALDPVIASQVIVKGMIDGLFTGVALRQFINFFDQDFFNARRVVNGTDRAQLISDHTTNLLNAYNQIT